MQKTRNRVVIVIVAIAVIAGLLACSTGTLIGRQAEPSATPTKTPKPTFTVTSTPTQTPVPTNTMAPTDTPTPVTPTNTPVILTATFTPVPSDTPVPVDTATPVPPTKTPKPTKKPTQRPSQPKPTATQAPPPPTPQPQFPWRGEVAGTFSNCALTQVMGLTLDRNGGVAGDIWIHYWTDGWDGAWAKSSWTVDKGYAGTGDEKNWDGTIDNYAKPGTWYVCVVPQQGSWDCISPKMTAKTVHEPCTPDSGGIQVVRFVFQQN